MFETLKKPEVVAAIIMAIATIGVAWKTSRNNSVQTECQRNFESITKNRIEEIQKLRQYMSEYITFTSYYETKKIPEDLNLYFEKLNDLTSKVKLHLNFIGDADSDIFKNMEDLNIALGDFLYCIKTKQDSDCDNDCPYSNKYIKYFIKNYLSEENEKNKNILARVIKEEKIKFNDKNDYEKLIKRILNKDEATLEKIFIAILVEIDYDMKNKLQKIKYGSELIELLTQIYLKTEWERIKIESSKGNIKKFDFDSTYYKYKNQVKDKIENIESKMKYESR